MFQIRRIPNAFLSSFFASFLLASPAIAQNPDRFALSPGVVVDRSNGRIFVMERSKTSRNTAAIGGVAAINAVDGKVVWKNQKMMLPLLADRQNQLVGAGMSAQGEKNFPLLVVGEADGKLRKSLSIPLEGDIRFSPTETARGSLAVVVQEEGEELLVNWRYRESQRYQAQPRRRLLPDGNDAPPVGPLNVNAGNAANATSVQHSYRVNVQSGEVRPSQVVDPAVAPQAVDNPPDSAAVLTALVPEVKLPMFLSADKRHVIARKRTKGEEHRYLFQIIDVKTKQKIGELPSNAAIAPFYLDTQDGKKVIVIEKPASFALQDDNKIRPVPPNVSAVDLSNGKLLWTHPIVDRQFRGQLPH